jgi:hypothetical protein
MLRTYRESVHKFSKMSALTLFYKQLPVEDAMEVLQSIGEYAGKKEDKDGEKKDKKKKKEDGKKKDKKKKDDSDGEKKDKKKKKGSDGEKKDKKKKGSDGEKKDKKKKKGSDGEKKDKKKKAKKEAQNETFNAPNGLPWSERMVEKAIGSDHNKAFNQLVDNSIPSALEFKSQPPVLVPLRDLPIHNSRTRQVHAFLVCFVVNLIFFKNKTKGFSGHDQLFASFVSSLFAGRLSSFAGAVQSARLCSQGGWSGVCGHTLFCDAAVGLRSERCAHSSSERGDEIRH